MPNLPKRHSPFTSTKAQQAVEASKRDSMRMVERVYDRERGSPSVRGYDAAWRRFREAYLNEHPLCADCIGDGVYKPAREVHHIAKLRDAPELKLDATNVLGLCKSCHSSRTARGE